MNGVVLPGLRADNPMAFLVALGTLDLLTDAGDEPTLAWQPARGTWLATVAAAGATNLETLVDRIHAAHLQRDVDAELDWGSELTKVKRQALRARLAANVADHNRDASLRLAGALAAELPAHGELVRQTPFCLFPILGKRSFLKTVREQTLALSRNDIDTCLRLWRHQRGINTLRLDPSARVQENAIMGPDPSTAGVVGVPAAAPLAIRGLGFYPLRPQPRAPGRIRSPRPLRLARLAGPARARRHPAAARLPVARRPAPGHRPAAARPWHRRALRRSRGPAEGGQHADLGATGAMSRLDRPIGELDPLPARVLNEHAYCPRLAYLMWADREFRDNAATADGTVLHRRVDRTRDRRAPTREEIEPLPTTSVWLSSERLGITAKVDLLEGEGEGEGSTVVPVEYKRGRPATGAHTLREPERVQLAAQVLLLREAGYSVPHAEVYFAGTRSRDRVEIDDELVERTLEVAAEVRANAARDEAPPRLVDDPKCAHCVLVGLCLPDEVEWLERRKAPPPRRLVARAEPAEPLYLTEQRARLTKRGGRLVLSVEGEEAASVRLLDVSHVAVFGNATISSAALRACFEAGLPVLWFSYGGWLAGYAGPLAGGSVRVRMRQHRAAMVGAPQLAARFVTGKLANCRTLVRRHLAGRREVQQLAALEKQAEKERELAALLGVEGTAARLYFACFAHMLRPPRDWSAFDFEGRNRRPPRDPVNALLSFAYAMLVKDVTVALLSAGLDPYVGVYHRPRFGRPALALDLAEEFRPLIADSAVLRMVNNGEIRSEHFVASSGAVALTAAGRRRAIAAFERRMADELRHPLFAYRATYRRSLEIQARLLAAVFAGELAEYRPLTTR